jgi:hypothetical protein
MAARASLQYSYTDQIMKPRQLLNWAQTDIQNMLLSRIHRKEEKLLCRRNSTTEPIYKLCASRLIRKSTSIVKTFSTSAVSEECFITQLKENMTPDEAKGLATHAQCLVVRMHHESERKLNVQWK